MSPHHTAWFTEWATRQRRDEPRHTKIDGLVGTLALFSGLAIGGAPGKPGVALCVAM